MSKGFLVIAQNTESVDYVRQAYALALSIKNTQNTHTSISIVTNDNVPEEYRSAFDNIIAIPWVDETVDTKFKTENRWKYYHVTPYEETIVLDTDMLFLEDIAVWWEYLSHFDLKFCSHVANYKLEKIYEDTYHRRAFIENKLSNPYFAFHYFKKTDLALEFYKTLEFVIKNWELCYGKFAPVDYQNWPSMDLSAAVAIEILGIDGVASTTDDVLEFIHMKTPLQGWEIPAQSWQDTVSHYFTTEGKLFVSNIQQHKVFHYVEKDFLTDNIIRKLEVLNG